MDAALQLEQHERNTAVDGTAARRTIPKTTGAAPGPAVTNASIVNKGKTSAVIPLPMEEIISQVNVLTGGELHRVGKELFAHKPGQDISWLSLSPNLFGWMHSRCGGVRWHRGTGCVTKDELFSELQRTATAHEAIETIPHWPTIPTHYYTCRAPSPGDGQKLSELVDMHCLETDLDRELAMAMYATAAWGGPGGTRPAFLITAISGRGKGKTRFAQHFASVFGGQLDISPQEEIGVIKQRLLSPDAKQKRIATLDNIKTARFSWGDLENLITASIISGKELYVGEGTRPNLLTWTITLNGASLSTDMAQRVVEIRLREPNYDAGWEERVAAFIVDNHERIIADCIGFLQRPAKPMERHSRWATWESQVLSKVDHPNECLSLVVERRGAVDVEQEESAIVEDYFASRLQGLGYDAERDDVFIPNDLAAKWYNGATGDNKKVTGVTRALKQLHDEGRVHRLIQSRNSERTARGFRWVGEHVDAIDVTHYDIRERIAHKLNERGHQTAGENQQW